MSPLAASVCPMLLFTEPMSSGALVLLIYNARSLVLDSALEALIMFARARVSASSPTFVPVPWHSTYRTGGMLTCASDFAIVATLRYKSSCVSTHGVVIPCPLPDKVQCPRISATDEIP